MGKLPPLTIRFQGIFDYERFYQYIFQWLKDYEYDYYEKEWIHKKSEEELKINAERKVNFMVKYVIDFHFKIVDLKRIVRDGKEYSYGRLFLNIKPSFETDPLGVFKKKGSFVEWLGKTYFSLFYKKEFGVNYVDPLTYRVQELQFKLKQLLGMDTTRHEYKYELGLTK